MKTTTTFFFLSIAIFSQAQINQAYLLDYPEIDQKWIIKQQIKQLSINEYDKTAYQDRPMIQEIYYFDEKGKVVQVEFYGGETYTDTHYEWMNGKVVKISHTIYGETQIIIPVYDESNQKITINNQPKTERLEGFIEIVTLNKKGKITSIKRVVEEEKEARITTFDYKRKRQLTAKTTVYPTGKKQMTTYEYRKKKLVKANLPYVKYTYEYGTNGTVTKRTDSPSKNDKLYYTEYVYK